MPVVDQQKYVVEPSNGSKDSQAKSIIDGLINVYVSNPYNYSESSVYFQLTYEATLVIDIRPDYKLTGQVTRVRTAVRDYKAYFSTETKKHDLDKSIKELEPTI